MRPAALRKNASVRHGHMHAGCLGGASCDSAHQTGGHVGLHLNVLACASVTGVAPADLRVAWRAALQVRVVGGAYGGFCSFDSHSGQFTYLSYRCGHHHPTPPYVRMRHAPSTPY